MQTLELLAPARTADIGIAAIDCGADAVYIAGPQFGARQAAGNSVEDIARLCDYAHRFGARIFATVNTLIEEDERSDVQALFMALAGAGVDALILQDYSILPLAAASGLLLHASTQCAIRTPEKALALQSMGFGRLVLERQLSMAEVRAIRDAVDVEIETFVHGSLCMCYSGECFLSEFLTGRSANRGACAQPCRSRYDLEDASGKVLVKDKALLSLKDLKLIDRLEEMADAGICSFKIEGRLKNETYVRNVVKAYSEALDALVARHPERYRRSSFGHVRGGFVPDLEKSFHRDYTQLYFDGKRGPWAAMEAPKAMGESIGTVDRLLPDGFTIRPFRPGLRLSNGDGLAFIAQGGEILGFRADVCNGMEVHCKRPSALRPGATIYRNMSLAFEKSLAATRSERLLDVKAALTLDGKALKADATSEDGRTVSLSQEAPADTAQNQTRMREIIAAQIGKTSGQYAFALLNLTCDGALPFFTTSALNEIRRSLAALLDRQPVKALPMNPGHVIEGAEVPAQPRFSTELMRSRYCVRHELGLCPKQKKSGPADDLYLRNASRLLRLRFHCATCEMSVEAVR